MECLGIDALMHMRHIYIYIYIYAKSSPENLFYLGGCAEGMRRPRPLPNGGRLRCPRALSKPPWCSYGTSPSGPRCPNRLQALKNGYAPGMRRGCAPSLAQSRFTKPLPKLPKGPQRSPKSPPLGDHKVKHGYAPRVCDVYIYIYIYILKTIWFL